LSSANIAVSITGAQFDLSRPQAARGASFKAHYLVFCNVSMIGFIVRYETRIPQRLALLAFFDRDDNFHL
jgi:hypothetical protein